MDRYHRQTILPEFGESAAAALKAGHAMLIGCGALGCPAADLLVRAGVGLVSIVDRDLVELTNLQRQTLFDERDATEGMPKAEAAARRLRAVNSAVRVQALVEDFAGRDAERIVSPHPRPGVVLDCTDNFETRYLINDVCVKLGVPYIYGGAVGVSGMTMVVVPGKTACLRCVFEDAPDAGSAPTCDTAGILGPVAAMVGAWQAAEAIKVLIGRGERSDTALTSFDAWRNTHRRLDPGGRRSECPCCGKGRFDFLEAPKGEGPRVLCGRNSVQISPSRSAELDLAMLGARLAAVGAFSWTEHHLRGKVVGEAREYELTVFPDGRAIIGGTTDPVEAKAVYARYVGA